MLLLVGTFIVLLGFAVFALRGLFGTFEDNWNWVGIIFSVMGLITGVLGIIQSVKSRPKIIFSFEVVVEEKERCLALFLKNQPLDKFNDLEKAIEGKKSFWSKLGFKRDTVGSLTISFRISEVGTGRILIPVRQSKIYTDADDNDSGSWRTTVPPTISFQTSTIFAQWNNEKKTATVPATKTQSNFELQAGLYEIVVIVALEGIPTIHRRQFVVGETAGSLAWVRVKAS